MDTRKSNVLISKVGGNASKDSKKYRVGIPTIWAKQMGLSEDNRDLVLSFDGECITIRTEKKSAKNYLINNELSRL